MNLNQRVLACHGHLTAKSTAIVCRCSRSQVYNIWFLNNLRVIKKNKHRLLPKWK